MAAPLGAALILQLGAAAIHGHGAAAIHGHGTPGQPGLEIGTACPYCGGAGDDRTSSKPASLRSTTRPARAIEMAPTRRPGSVLAPSAPARGPPASLLAS